MSSTAADSIAGVVIPDTPLVRAITAHIRDAEDDLLFNHSRRVFLFGALQGRRRGLQPDLELLYAGAMFHDIGLTERYRNSTLRFEVDGANAARDFLLEHGVDEADADKVWLGIALHTTPGVPEFRAPETALVTAGVETDVLGIGRDDLPPKARGGHRRAPSTRFQAADPGGVQRRHEAPSPDHVRDVQCRCPRALRPLVRPRQLRRQHSGQHLARITTVKDTPTEQL